MAIPSLPRTPLLGNLGEFRRDKIALFHRLRATCGDLGAFHLGPRQVVVVSSPELAHAVLVEHAEAFEKGPTLTTFARPVLGDGLLSVGNAAHKRRRRLVNPSFTLKQIAGYADEMVAAAERAAAGWPDGAQLDLAEEMMRLTLRIIGRSLFSVDLIEQAREVRDALELLQHHVTGLMKSLVPLPLWVPTPHNFRVRRAVARLDATIFGMIDERRRNGRTDDLLSTLVFSRAEDGSGGFTDRQIRDEAMTLFVAGHETTAFTLAWSFHLLMQHPEVWARLTDELERVLGGRAPRFEDLPRLPYALQVLKESMRMFPPVHSVGRVASRDVVVCGQPLPAGTIVLVSVMLLHARADLFPSPERFDPERFGGDGEQRLPRHAYLPFGLGPRTCVGYHFALIEAQLVLATLAQRVRFSPLGAPVEPEMLVTLRPKGGLKARVHRSVQPPTSG